MIAGQHAHAHAHGADPVDGFAGILPGRVEERDQSQELPGPVVPPPGHAQRPESLSGEIVGVRVHRFGECRVGRAQAQHHLGRTLGEIPLFPVAARQDLAAFADRVERREVVDPIAVQRARFRQRAEHSRIDGVRLVAVRGQRCRQQHALRVGVAERGYPSHRELVLGQGAGLVGAEHVHTRHLLDGDQPRDDGFHARELLGADGHGYGQYRRQCHGDGGDGEDQREADGLQHRVVPEQGDHHDQRYQGKRPENQEIADAQHRPLEMGAGPGLLHQPGRMAEEGLHAGGRHHAGHLALFGRRPGIGGVAELFVHRQGLTGQRGLVHAQVAALRQVQVGRDDVAHAHRDDVARHQQPGG